MAYLAKRVLVAGHLPFSAATSPFFAGILPFLLASLIKLYAPFSLPKFLQTRDDAIRHDHQLEMTSNPPIVLRRKKKVRKKWSPAATLCRWAWFRPTKSFILRIFNHWIWENQLAGSLGFRTSFCHIQKCYYIYLYYLLLYYIIL